METKQTAQADAGCFSSGNAAWRKADKSGMVFENRIGKKISRHTEEKGNVRSAPAGSARDVD